MSHGDSELVERIFSYGVWQQWYHGHVCTVQQSSKVMTNATRQNVTKAQTMLIHIIYSVSPSSSSINLMIKHHKVNGYYSQQVTPKSREWLQQYGLSLPLQNVIVQFSKLFSFPLQDMYEIMMGILVEENLSWTYTVRYIRLRLLTSVELYLLRPNMIAITVTLLLSFAKQTGCGISYIGYTAIAGY